MLVPLGENEPLVVGEMVGLVLREPVAQALKEVEGEPEALWLGVAVELALAVCGRAGRTAQARSSARCSARGISIGAQKLGARVRPCWRR